MRKKSQVTIFVIIGVTILLLLIFILLYLNLFYRNSGKDTIFQANIAHQRLNVEIDKGLPIENDQCKDTYFYNKKDCDKICSISYKDYCYFTIARAEKNYSLCFNMRYGKNYAICFYKAAIETGDKGYCLNIPDSAFIGQFDIKRECLKL